MEAYEALRDYYAGYDEDGRLLSKHGSVEFATTVKYIEKYLKPWMKLLEVGAGTGRYSHYFAGRGYEVDAVELIPSNIEKFKAAGKNGERVRIFEGSAVDLSFLGDESYDIVLLLGPMYHLFSQNERYTALLEAKRVLKKGGIMFAAYCMNDPTIVMYCFGQGMIHEVLDKGMVDESFKCHSKPEDLFVLDRRDDIFALTEPLGMERLHFIGTDMYTNYFRDMVDGMDEKTLALWVSYCLSICEREDLVGLSNHTLDVLRK